MVFRASKFSVKLRKFSHPICFKVPKDHQKSPGGTPGTMLGWFFQWAFCTAGATIVSGAVAERVKGPTYAAFAFVPGLDEDWIDMGEMGELTNKNCGFNLRQIEVTIKSWGLDG
jgi:hypothetical protein